MTSKPRSWWRRWAWRAVLAIVVGRVLLAVCLPWLVRLGGRTVGLEVTYRSASLSLLGLSVRFDDLVARATDFPDDPALLQAQEIVVDLAMTQLLRGKLGVVDVAIDGGHLELRRDSAGRLHLPHQLTDQKPDQKPAAPGAAPTEPQPVHFDLPVQIASARVHDLRWRFHDDAVTPPLAIELTLDADISDLGWTDRPGRLAVRLHSPEWFDDLWFTASTTTTAEQLGIVWQAALRGLRPAALPLPPSALAPLGQVRSIDLAWHGELHGQTVAEAPRRPRLDANLQLEAVLDQRQRLTAELQAGPSQNTTLGTAVPFTADLHGDDLIEALHVQNGRLSIEPEHTTLTAELAANGVTLALLQPWLGRLGVQMPTGGLALQAACQADLRRQLGATSVSAEITQLTVHQGEEHLDVARLAIADLRHDDQGVVIGRVELDGPDVTIFARAGELSVAGVRLVAPPAAAAAAQTSAAQTGATPTTGPASQAAALPNFALEHLDWHGLRVVFTDTTLATPATLSLQDGRVTADGIVLGRDAPPARCVATCRIPDAIGEVRAELRLAQKAQAVAVEAEVQALGITAAALAPWLLPHGITPLLQDGRLSLVATTDVTLAQGQLVANAHLGNLRLQDGNELLLGLRNLDLRELRAGAAPLDLGTWSLEEPFLALHRPTPTTWRALGLQIAPTPVAARPAPPSTPAPAAAPTTGDATPPAVAAVPTPPLRHGPLTVHRALVRVTAADQPTLALGADLELGADLGTGAATTFTTTLRLDQGVDEVQVRGSLAMTPTQLNLQAELDGHGLRGPFLSQLLPQGVSCTLLDGGLHAELQADVTLSPSLAVHLSGKHMQFSDHGEELAAIDEIDCDLPHLSADRCHVANLQVLGVRAVLGSTAEGLHVPGFLLAPVAAPDEAPSAPHTAAVATTDAPATPPPPVTPAPLVPALMVDALDLQIERITWRERRQQEGEPLLMGLRLRLDAPWSTAADLAETLPAKFTVQASFAPVCRECTVAVTLQPFQLQPSLDLQVQAHGIDTTSLTRIAPSLATRLQGLVTEGELVANLHASLDLRRRDARRFDFRRPFGGEFLLEGADFRAAPAGPSLGSVAAIEVLARSFDPQSGDLLLRSIVVDGPMLQTERTAAGTEVLGLRLLPTPAAEPQEPAPSPPPSAKNAPPGRVPEFAIDRLTVQGLAFGFVDSTTTPSTHLPIEDVDFELRRFSTRALTEPRQFRFTLAVRGGQVDLAQRVVRSSALAGFLSSTVDALAGQADVHAQERRPLLDEFSLAGELQLQPTLTGNVHGSLDAFELPALRGLAKAGGVDIADGLLDAHFDAELGRDGIQVVNRTTFTWLSLSEPPGGPISTYLRLPAPLDTVLFLLRNEDDEHRIPLHLQVPAEGLGMGAIAGAAATAVLGVVTDAVAGAALRATGALSGAIGIGGGDDMKQLRGIANFVAGDPTPAFGERPEDLAALLAAVAPDSEWRIVLTHELGAADLARAGQLANPPAPVIAQTVHRLQDERRDAARRHEDLAAQVAALLAAGQMHAALGKQVELSQLDDGLGRLEQSLDAALGMLADQNPRAAARRTKQAAIAMATARLQAVNEELRQRLGRPDLPIEWRQPRAVTTADLPEGGRIVISLGRRAAK